MRLWATTRRPAFSNRAMISPVRLRRVASGLTMERVRSTAMGYSLERRAPYSGGLRTAASFASPRAFAYDRGAKSGVPHVAAQSFRRHRRLRPQPAPDG